MCRRYLPQEVKGKIINISNSAIQDKRKLRGYGGKLRIVYPAAARESKGFFMLKEALDELWAEGVRDFELDVYSEPRNVSGYMKVMGAYSTGDLDIIYEHADLCALLTKYGHQSNFWQRLELEMSHKDLEIDHYLGMLKHCPFKSHMERSKRTGKLIRIYD